MISHVPQVIVAEREDELARLILHQMESAGYRTRRTTTMLDTLHACTESPPDLVIVDSALVRQVDFPTLHSLRHANMAPVLVLVPRSNELDWWELGASDCITKPFSWTEFMGRARALLRAQNV